MTRPVFRDSASLAKLLRMAAAVLIAYQIPIILLLCATAFVGYFPDEASVGAVNGLYRTLDPFINGIDILHTGLSILVLLLLLTWNYRTTANLRALGVHTRYSPRMAVFCYFIPILGLFMPYLGMKDIFERSTDPRLSTKPWPECWWFCLLLNIILDRILSFIPDEQFTPPLIVLTITSLLLNSASCLLLPKIVRTVESGLKERRKSRPATAAE